jgi:hypothetical protein
MYSLCVSDIERPLQGRKGRGVAHRQPSRLNRDSRSAFDDGWQTLDVLQAVGEKAWAPAT